MARILTPFSRFLTSFHARSLPMMARLGYQRELLSWSFIPLMLGALQAGTIAIFLKKTFAGVEGVSASQLDLAVSIVAASQSIGFLVSFAWVSLSRGRRKVRLMVWLQLATAIFVGSIAFASRSSTGLWTVVLLCISAWTLWSGVTTLRTRVWRANYRAWYRPRITGRFATIQSLLIAGCGLVIGWCLDMNSNSYRFIFPTLACMGVVGALLFRRIPFRRETMHLAEERAADAADGATNAYRRHASPMMVARVLREDKWYRGYLICMFVMGFGNLMLHPILAIALADTFDVGYQQGIIITTVIPLVCMTFAIPFWSRRLERMHVIEYRAVHVWSFAVVTSLVLLGVGLHQIVWLYLAAMMTGVGWGGGVLAWNLGHQHFSPPDRDAEYMSTHMTLTGIRGVIGPILGVQLYTLLSHYGWQYGALMTCFGFCLFVNISGALGFVLLARMLRAHKKLDETDTAQQDKSRELALSR